ncbi:L domain-like protein [Anaeromyces robustus]|uniref:L domain-like protein n=1 Tax=Anaeromyces robustus TaxID=1754192 RepID=A0A1Y1XL93_9FUNG|nr:L domain-like protein [Anaeromyces robustus]|eukprot:ORX86530.1 L domain-like protein [Anaeromyces robustus]
MLFQKYSNLIFTKILLLGVLIPNIIATDCDILANAIAALGGTLQTEYATVTNCCLFKGITCDSSNRIFDIRISNFINPLGDLDKAVEEFTKLEFLTSLKIDNVKTKAGSGISKKIGQIENLKYLTITNNKYDCTNTTIPEEIGNLVNLETLDLSNNDLTGNIPTSFTKLKNIQSILLGDNKLEGVVPFDFEYLDKLTELVLKQNTKLKGYVPHIPNLSTCYYYGTNLCYLITAKCRSSKGCTADEIKDTNKYNGSPYSSKHINDAVKKTNSTSNTYNNSSNSGRNISIVTIAIIVVFIYFCCKCCCGGGKKGKKLFKLSQQQQQQQSSNYNEYVNSTSNNNNNNNNNGNTSTIVTPYPPTNTPGNVSINMTQPNVTTVTPYPPSNEVYNPNIPSTVAQPVMPPPIMPPVMQPVMPPVIQPVMPYNSAPVDTEIPPPVYTPTPVPYNTSYVNFGPVSTVPDTARDISEDPNAPVVSVPPVTSVAPVTSTVPTVPTAPTAPVDPNVQPIPMPVPVMPMPTVSPIPMAPVTNESIDQKPSHSEKQ